MLYKILYDIISIIKLLILLCNITNEKDIKENITTFVDNLVKHQVIQNIDKSELFYNITYSTFENDYYISYNQLIIDTKKFIQEHNKNFFQPPDRKLGKSQQYSPSLPLPLLHDKDKKIVIEDISPKKISDPVDKKLSDDLFNLNKDKNTINNTIILNQKILSIIDNTINRYNIIKTSLKYEYINLKTIIDYKLNELLISKIKNKEKYKDNITNINKTIEEFNNLLIENIFSKSRELTVNLYLYYFSTNVFNKLNNIVDFTIDISPFNYKDLDSHTVDNIEIFNNLITSLYLFLYKEYKCLNYILNTLKFPDTQKYNELYFQIKLIYDINFNITSNMLVSNDNQDTKNLLDKWLYNPKAELIATKYTYNSIFNILTFIIRIVTYYLATLIYINKNSSYELFTEKNIINLGTILKLYEYLIFLDECISTKIPPKKSFAWENETIEKKYNECKNYIIKLHKNSIYHENLLINNMYISLIKIFYAIIYIINNINYLIINCQDINNNNFKTYIDIYIIIIY